MKKSPRPAETTARARQLRRDSTKPEALQKAGLKVIRVLNDDVLTDLEAVARYIGREAGVSVG